MLKRFFKKLKSKKGLTGTDVAISIVLIVMTMGVVTAIYINTVNKSRDNIRHANATRIATALAEKVQDLPYDTIIRSSNNYEVFGNTGDNTKIYGVSIPAGYSALVDSNYRYNPDISIDVKITVKYFTRNGKMKTINYTVRKDKELLEETNKPDLAVLYQDYGNDNTINYYPVRKIGSNWVVTDWDDPLWYKYDASGTEHVYATVLKTTNTYSFNNQIAFNSSTGVDSSVENIYFWIPRFATRTVDSVETIEFAYLASDYKISWGKFRGRNTAGTISEISAFMLTSSDTIYGNNGEVKNYAVMDTVNVPSGGYLNGTNNSFMTNDGRTGYWYRYGDTTTSINTPENRMKTMARNAAIEFEKKLPVELGESATIEANAIR